MNYLPLSCSVCGNEGDGQHFGVHTCRACAMFFRRSEHRKEDYVCRRHPDKPTGKCDLSKSHACKYCRLEKCWGVGMSNRKDTPPKKAPTTREIIKRAERISYPIIDPVTGKETEWINLDPLIRRSRRVLEEFLPPTTSHFLGLNPLQKMRFSLDNLNSRQIMDPKFAAFMSFDDYFTHWEELMVRAAKWLMHSEQFNELPEHERLKFFKIVWGVWRRFERCTMSVRVFGQRCLDEKLFLISDDVATRIVGFQVDYSKVGVSNRFGRYQSGVRQIFLHYFEAVVKRCLEWSFSDMELNFALCQIVWNYASRKLLGQTLQAADSFLSEISENLHEYYQNEMRLKNYAPRLAVLMEIVNGVLKIQAEHEKTMEMVFLFDSFGCIFSDPKFFCV